MTASEAAAAPAAPPRPDEPAGPDRAVVLELLAGFGARAPGSVGDELGSLELTWLIATFEQRYSIVVDLDDTALSRIRTVGEAVDALRAVLGLPPLEAADGGA